MRYKERPEYPCDPEVFKLSDTQTAMMIYDESVSKHSARPTPIFLEVDRSLSNIDPLWHTPLGGNEKLSRRFDLPAINLFPNGKNEWTMKAYGMVPQRRDDFILSHLSLIKFDYFPVRGDYVIWNGYQYMITFVEIPGEAYWGQTNVWLGLKVKCMIPAGGDGKPTSFPLGMVPQTNVPSASFTEVVPGGVVPKVEGLT